MKVKKGYCFDDVLLEPKYSKIGSRSEVDLSVSLGKGINLDIPIVSANMKSVTETDMVVKLRALGGLPILHRFMSDDDRVYNVNKFVRITDNLVGHSVGIGSEERAVLDRLVLNGARVICVDVAHGDHELCCQMVSHISNNYSEVLLIAGNVSTKSGAIRLFKSGADVVKVGVGNGSTCSTRIETGNGVPQMTALSEIYEAAKKFGFKVIADGGMRKAGDLVKALCFSDAVMLGSILAGTDEAPGDIVEIDGFPMKSYEGSSTHKSNHIEGVKAMVPLKGPVEILIKKLLEGVRSGCSYQGVDNLNDLKRDPVFIEMSSSGLVESHPHIMRGRV